MKFFGLFVIIGTICCFLAIVHQISCENINEIKINFARNTLDHVEKFSGEHLLVFDDEDGDEKGIYDLMLVTSVKSSQKKEITIRFKAKLQWNEEYREAKSQKKKFFEETFSNYFYDLLVKLKIKKATLTYAGLIMNPTEFDDLVHFNVIVECENGNKSVPECQFLVKRVAKNFSVKELLVYYHEIGYSENINPGKAVQIPQT